MPQHARRTGAIVLGILVILVLFLWLFDWSPLTGPLAGLASRALHRQVQIGHFRAHLLRRSPTVMLQNLQVANPSWASGDPMARISRISAAIDLLPLFRGKLVFSLLEIDDGRLDLYRDAKGRASWDFNAAAENPKDKLPPKPAGTPTPRVLARVGALRTGRFFYVKILDDYSHTLDELREAGYVTYASRQLSPYLRACMEQFSRQQRSMTERMLQRIRG